MLKKPNVNKVIKLKAYIFLLFFILTSCQIVICFHTIKTIFNSGNRNLQLLESEISHLQYFISLIIILTLAFIISLLFSIKRIKDSSEKFNPDAETIIHQQELELEKQSKLIGNITKLYNDAVEYYRFKTEFFSNISHDLKTPLTVILGAIQLSEQHYVAQFSEHAKLGKHLHTIKHNCFRLLRLINNILDITRIDSGYLKVNMVNCNIVYLVEEIAQSVIPYAQQKMLLLEFDTDTEEIITAVDIDKFERSILNLLSNAIKFTPEGGKISVTVSKGNEKVAISIRDTGPGIPKSMQTAIFERFRQVNSSLTKDYEGSGIGLSLVKSFIELHNGSIEVKSEETKGSEFIIDLPVTLCKSDDNSPVQLSKNQSKVIEAINIEFSDLYYIAS